jgi:two-component system OmpR family response regulator
MTAAHILVVEDDPEIAELVLRLLRAEGWRASRAAETRAARRLLEAEGADLLVLDLMLPGEDGLAFCRALRAEGRATPIVMLTAKGDDLDRILGLEMGADDYLPKPFHGRELVARIRAVLRRSDPAARRPGGARRFVGFEGWRLDTAKRELVDAEGVVVPLGSAEFELLSAFLAWPQAVLSREKLLDATRGRTATISDRSIDIQVSRLRRKLGDDPRSPRIIKTVWGDGYIFTPDVT